MKQLAKKTKILLAFACVLCLSLGMVFLGVTNTAKAADSKLVDGCALIEEAPEVPADKTADVRQASAPTGILHLEVGKTKKTTYHGIYNVDGKVAYYFSNEAESGAAEVRFSTEGTNTVLSSGSRIYAVDSRVTKISFSYKVKNTSVTSVPDIENTKYYLQIFGPGSPDKYNGYGWTAMDYTSDDNWQTMSLTLSEDDRAIFSGFIFKMGGLTGELLIADVSVELDSEIGILEQVNKEPEGLLHIETKKVKEMTYHGLFNADGKVAYYFTNETKTGAGETRFATKGTDTTPGSGSRIYDVDKRVKKFTFNYKMLNTSENEPLQDGGLNGELITGNTMIQVYGPDYATGKDKYLGRMIDTVDYTTNTEWQTVTIELTDNDKDIFSGFIFKMHGLKGELLIADIKPVIETSLGELTQSNVQEKGVLRLEAGKKLKYMEYGGLYTVDGKTGYYFYNDAESGNAEARFATEGTNTQNGPYVLKQYNGYSYSFDYRIKNTATTTVKDRTTDRYITQVLGSDGSYDVLTFEPIEDGEWHSYKYVLTDAQTAKFAGFIVKMGGLTGEMLIANVQVASEPIGNMVKGTFETTEAAGTLHIETQKVKNMSYNGVYDIDGKAAYHFSNSDARTNAEARFVTPGTDTWSANRIYNNYPAYKFSFSYKIVNASTDGVTDGEHWPYIVQILDRSYPILSFTPAVDGEWHTQEYTLSPEQTKLFAGFIVKMGRLDGEMLIADISVEERTMVSGCEVATEPEGLLHIETGKVKSMTYKGVYNVDGTAAYHYIGKDAAKAETRFITEGTFTGDPNSSRVYNYHPEAIKFSFRYKLTNTASAQLVEALTGRPSTEKANVIVQVLEPKYAHNYEFVTNNDGEWHTFEYTLTSADRSVFAGFIIKFGKFNGELLVADIKVELDKVAPVITVADTTKREYNEGEEPVINATAVDAVDGNVNVTVSYPDGALVDGKLVAGTWNVTLTATDVAGNVATEAVTITVKDITKPVITVENTTKREYKEGETPVINATAVDAVDGNVNVTVSYQDGALNAEGKLNIGQWKVTLTATDKAGNEAKEEITINVTDGTKPIITAADAEFVPGTVYDKSILGITVTDDVDEDIDFTVTYETGAVVDGKLQSGTWHFTITATDSAGNETTKIITVDVNFIVGATEVKTEPVDVLHLEQKKVKFATYEGIYVVDGKTAYYFTHDVAEGATKNTEVRFSYGRTDTSGDSANRVYESYKAKKLSFEYKLINRNPMNCDDEPVHYIVQTFGELTPGKKDCKYPVHVKEVVADGEWHTIEHTFDGQDLAIAFSGFLFKMGGFEGELLVANVIIEDSEAPVITVAEDNKTVYTVGETLNLKVSAHDAHDGDVKCETTLPEGMVVEGKLVKGTWTVIVKAVDKYNNKAEKQIKITVKEAGGEEPDSTESNSTGSSESTKPSESSSTGTSTGGEVEPGGCFGSVSGVAGLALVALMAAAFVVCKKKED